MLSAPGLPLRALLLCAPLLPLTGVALPMSAPPWSSAQRGNITQRRSQEPVLPRAARTPSPVGYLTTAPPMAHVIINEVLANPVGEEPQQEWVELYNDGLAPAHLLGWQLEDVGGEASLPDVTLPPGAFALVVNESFDPESEWDPMPPPNVPLLRVAELGNNGLANGGEPMRLRNAMGVIVSRFPDEPKPKPGQSVARIHPKALDGVEGTFVRADPPTRRVGAQHGELGQHLSRPRRGARRGARRLLHRSRDPPPRNHTHAAACACRARRNRRHMLRRWRRPRPSTRSWR